MLLGAMLFGFHLVSRNASVTIVIFRSRSKQLTSYIYAIIVKCIIIFISYQTVKYMLFSSFYTIHGFLSFLVTQTTMGHLLIRQNSCIHSLRYF